MYLTVCICLCSVFRMSSNQLSVICKVRAQVMARDEYTGGWLPLPIRGGSLCTVMLCRGQSSGGLMCEYYIIGKRIEDSKDILNCCIKRDFIYNKVMPTFHHWQTNDSKFGLTFVTATEARLFDRSIREAFSNMFNNERESKYIRRIWVSEGSNFRYIGDIMIQYRSV